MSDKSQQKENVSRMEGLTPAKAACSGISRWSNIWHHPRLKVVRFVVCGGIQTAYAVSINIVLVELLQTNKAISYAIVQVTQMLIAMLMNRYVVFDRGKTGIAKLSLQYVLWSLLFRGSHWFVYTLQIRFLREPYEVVSGALLKSKANYYLIAQGICITIFLVAKFFVFRRIFEAGKDTFEQK